MHGFIQEIDYDIYTMKWLIHLRKVEFWNLFLGPWYLIYLESFPLWVYMTHGDDHKVSSLCGFVYPETHGAKVRPLGYVLAWNYNLSAVPRLTSRLYLEGWSLWKIIEKYPYNISHILYYISTVKDLWFGFGFEENVLRRIFIWTDILWVNVL